MCIVDIELDSIKSDDANDDDDDEEDDNDDDDDDDDDNDGRSRNENVSNTSMPILDGDSATVSTCHVLFSYRHGMFIA
jgi:hypothetical protein